MRLILSRSELAERPLADAYTNTLATPSQSTAAADRCQRPAGGRLDIAPGHTTRGWRSAVFYVWDQVDLLTLSWPLLMRWVRPSVDRVLISVAIALLLHPLTSLLGYTMGARKSAR